MPRPTLPPSHVRPTDVTFRSGSPSRDSYSSDNFSDYPPAPPLTLRDWLFYALIFGGAALVLIRIYVFET